MDLWIMRHGIAEERRPELEESDRTLTELGTERTRAIAAWMAKRSIEPHTIHTSPWVRAHQTATLAQHAVGGHLSPTQLLIAEPGPALHRLLQTHTPSDTLLVVGHEPWLSTLATQLLGTPALDLTLKKGGLLHLRGTPEPGGMGLRALLSPKTML